MNDTNTGGPAFPAPAGVAHITEQGMTLRDYFAAKALSVIYVDADDDDHAAMRAYDMADAMLKAREA